MTLQAIDSKYMEEINARVKEVYGESFLVTDSLETVIAKVYDLGCSDTKESFEFWKNEVGIYD